jgi:DNA polymerase III subunit gamma/tau
VKVPLQRAVAAGLLPQQLLFSGGSGLGKTTIARICAAALFCETPMALRNDADCCGRCVSCLDIVNGTHPDVIEIDAASNGRVDEIREIASRAHLAPLRGTHRVYIVDEAHGLSPSGGQAFLKLLEEPPAHVMFMLATTDPQKMLHTNRSRCVEFELTPPSQDDVVQHLIGVARDEGVTLDETSAAGIVGASERDLGVRGVLMSLEKLLPLLRSGVHGEEISEVLGSPPSTEIRRLCNNIFSGSVNDALSDLAALRARFSSAKVLSRLGDEFRLELVHAAASGSRAKFGAVAQCCDEVVAASRSGGDLAATMSVVHMCAQFGINFTQRSTAERGIGGEPAQSMLQPSQASNLSETSNQSDKDDEDLNAPPESVNPMHPDEPSTGSETHSPVADAPYMSDPFTAELVGQPEPVVADTTQQLLAPKEADTVNIEGLLKHLTEHRSSASRLLVAKIRTARWVEESGVFVLYVQSSTFSRMSAPELGSLYTSMSALCGSTQVDVRPEPR